MDKFGIFKLLNSFLNFSGQNSPEQNNNSANLPTQSADLISNLFSSLNSKLSTPNSNDTPVEPKPASKKPVSSTPLQSQMLSTMTSHDQIVNRVKNKTH